MLSITTESSAVNSLQLDKESGQAQVEFSNGNLVNGEGVTYDFGFAS